MADRATRPGSVPLDLSGARWGLLGQSSVEYALLAVAFAALVAALAMLWRAAQGADVLGWTVRSASHAFGQTSAYELVHDIIVY